jgi:hypothetical protein
MDQIVRFETRAGILIAIDEAGKRFASPIGRFDWALLGDGAPSSSFAAFGP